MTPADLDRYFKKSGDTKLSPGEIVVNEHGFAIYRIDNDNDAIFIVHAYGDGMYWLRFFKTLAGVMHIKKLVFATKRSPKAFVRKFGFKVTGYILEKEVS